MNEYAVEHAREEIQKAERPRSAALWFGIFAAPAAWGTQLMVNYNMEESFLCAPAMGDPDKGQLFGLSLGWWVTTFNTVLALVAIAGLVAAYTCWRRIRRAGDDATAERAGFMAMSGIITSVLFLMSISIGFFPPLFLDSCQNSL